MTLDEALNILEPKTLFPPEFNEAISVVKEAMNQYRSIGTPEECRDAVEKQKEMITYCDENDCSDCPYHGGSQKENRCMNDFIVE